MATPLESRIFAAEKRAVNVENRLRRIRPLDVRDLEAGLSGGDCYIEFDFVVLSNFDGVTPVVGATVDLISAGRGVVASGATDANGKVTLTQTVADTYTWSVQATNTYVDQTGTIGAATCGEKGTVVVLLDPGFCARRLSQTFSAVESFYGVTVTLNYQLSAHRWFGCTTVSYAGGGGSGCTHTGTIGLNVWLTNAGLIRVGWQAITPTGSLPNYCPKTPSNCASPIDVQLEYSASTLSCPHPATATATATGTTGGHTSGGVAVTNAGNFIFPGGTSTVTCTETP